MTQPLCCVPVPPVPGTGLTHSRHLGKCGRYCQEQIWTSCPGHVGEVVSTLPTLEKCKQSLSGAKPPAGWMGWGLLSRSELGSFRCVAWALVGFPSGPRRINRPMNKRVPYICLQRPEGRAREGRRGVLGFLLGPDGIRTREEGGEEKGRIWAPLGKMRWGEFAPLIPVLRECTRAFPSEGAQYSERGHDLPVIIQQVRAEGRWPPWLQTWVGRGLWACSQISTPGLSPGTPLLQKVAPGKSEIWCWSGCEFRGWLALPYATRSLMAPKPLAASWLSL